MPIDRIITAVYIFYSVLITALVVVGLAIPLGGCADSDVNQPSQPVAQSTAPANVQAVIPAGLTETVTPEQAAQDTANPVNPYLDANGKWPTANAGAPTTPSNDPQAVQPPDEDTEHPAGSSDAEQQEQTYQQQMQANSQNAQAQQQQAEEQQLQAEQQQEEEEQEEQQARVNQQIAGMIAGGFAQSVGQFAQAQQNIAQIHEQVQQEIAARNQQAAPPPVYTPPSAPVISPPQTDLSSDQQVASDGSSGADTVPVAESCISSFYDPNMYNWFTWKDNCSYPVNVYFRLQNNTAGYGTNNVIPGNNASGNTGQGKNDIAQGGGWVWGACPQGYGAFDYATNQRWFPSTTQYYCKRTSTGG